MSMSNLIETFLLKIAKVCQVELYGFEMQSGKKSKKLIIYLDKTPAITSEDCDKFAKQLRISAPVEFPSLTQMLLEVSSPGIERQLFTLEHCQRNIDKKVKINLKNAIEEQKNFIGKLKNIDGNQLEIEPEDSTGNIHLDWNNIDKIRIIYEGKP